MTHFHTVVYIKLSAVLTAVTVYSYSFRQVHKSMKPNKVQGSKPKCCQEGMTSSLM